MKDVYEPFDNAEEVWFWFCNSLAARGDGFRSRSDYWGYQRVCEISDIQRIIKNMKMYGQITNRHLRVMSRWGELNTAPYYDRRAKSSEIRLWEEGIRNFEAWLKVKGIL